VRWREELTSATTHKEFLSVRTEAPVSISAVGYAYREWTRPLVLPAKGPFLVYQAEDGRVKLEVRLEDETVWLSQQHMAELFQTSRQNH